MQNQGKTLNDLIYVSESTSKTGGLVPRRELQRLILASRENKKSLYHSFYSFDQTLKRFSVGITDKEYTGSYGVQSLILDIDKAFKTTDTLLDSARTFYEKLSSDYMKDNKEYIVIWYTGSGIQFEIPNIFKFTQGNLLPEIVVRTLTTYFPECSMRYLKPAGLIMAAQTINTRTKVYKTPITEEELNNLNGKDIEELARIGEMRKISSPVEKCQLDYSERIIRYKSNVISGRGVSPYSSNTSTYTSFAQGRRSEASEQKIKIESNRDVWERLMRTHQEGPSSKSFDLNQIFNLGHEHRIVPQELIVITADTGVGKSALVQNICFKIEHLKVIYFTFEVGKDLMVRRFIQLSNELKKDEIFLGKKSQDELLEGFNHITSIDESVSLENMSNIIRELEPDVVVIDTLGDIIVNGTKDFTSKTLLLASELKKMAQALKKIFIAVHHIGKSAAEDENKKSRPLTKHSGKGASDIEQKADEIWGLEEISVDVDNGVKRLAFRSLKVRDKPPFETILRYDAGTSFRMYTVN